MKIFLYCVIITIIQFQSTFSNNFEINPITSDFNGVVTNNETIIVYGDYGSLLISYDSGENWHRKNSFKRGTIINVFFNEENITAFNSVGDISISNDNGNSWNIEKELGDSLLAVVQYTNGYFLRGRNIFFTISNSFEIQNEFNHLSPYIHANTGAGPIPLDYQKSLTFFKNHFIAEIDSSEFIRFDIDLIPVDTLSLKNSELHQYYKFGYWVSSDEKSMYFRVSTTEKGVLKGYIFKTDDFKSFENISQLGASNSIFKIIDNEIYHLEKKEKFLIDSTKLSSTRLWDRLMDFTVLNNQMIVVGKFNTICMINLHDSTLKVISEFTNSGTNPPYKYGDNSYLFFSGFYGVYTPYIYTSDDNGTTIKPTVNKKDPKYENGFHQAEFYFRHIDSLNNKFIFGGNKHPSSPTFKFISSDTCKSFSSESLSNQGFANRVVNLLINAMQSTNLFKFNKSFITTKGYNTYPFSENNELLYNSIVIYNKDFQETNIFVDSSNIGIDFIMAKDTNNFLVHCANNIDSTSELRYTTKSGNEWTIIHKYRRTELANYYKEIESNGRRYLALIHVNLDNSPDFFGMILDVVDLDDYTFTRIGEWYPHSGDESNNFGMYSIGIESDDNFVYISLQDTLFYAKDILDRMTWQYQTLPTKGARIVYPLLKFGDKFYSRYTDENIPWHDKKYFWIKPLDSLNTSVDDIADNRNYLYAYPPFPLPAMNEVRSLIYWDTGLEIDVEQIAVYNIYGTKVAGHDKIRLDKLNTYSGNLVWDCSGVESGIYVIHLKHGTENRIIKAIVTK